MDYLDPNRIRSRLSLRSLAESAGAIFRNASSHCPLHGGDNPTAFHLYADDTRWHCFTNCPPDANDGDIFTFYMRWKNVDFKTALHDLSNSMCHYERSEVISKTPKLKMGSDHLEPPSPKWQLRAESFINYCHDQLIHPTLGAPARAYLFSERGLRPETWETFRLGFNPHDIYDTPANWGISSPPSVSEGGPRG